MGTQFGFCQLISAERKTIELDANVDSCGSSWLNIARGS